MLAMNDTKIPDDLISLSEAAREFGPEARGALGVKYGIIRGLAERKEIRSWEFAGKVMVSRAELEKALRPKPRQ